MKKGCTTNRKKETYNDTRIKKDNFGECVGSAFGKYNYKTDFMLEITDIDSHGRGVGRLESGCVAFVPFAIPGETVLIAIENMKKNFAVGEIKEIIVSSQDRVNPRCVLHGKCGGCAIQHIEYKRQLEYKKEIVKAQLRKIGRMGDLNILSCIRSPKDYNYRNKAVFRFWQKNGKLEMGFFEEGTHKIVDCENCCICGEGINIAAKLIKEHFIRERISVENYVDGKAAKIEECNTVETAGPVKLHKKPYIQSVTIRQLGKKVLLCFSASDYLQLKAETLGEELKKHFDDYGILLLCKKNNGKSDMCLLLGSDKIAGHLCGLTFEASSETFLQVNSGVAERLYEDALTVAKISHEDIVIDAYSGIGIMSAMFARRSAWVYSIEIVPSATESAKALAKDNNIDNMTVLTGDCSLIMSDILNKIRNYDRSKQLVVVLDPPRKGCSDKVISAILQCLPDKIIYISCNSATLARDLSLLSSKYEIKSLTPYDMFPQTSEIEILAYLIKR